jgi:hypothetical protein
MAGLPLRDVSLFGDYVHFVNEMDFLFFKAMGVSAREQVWEI